MKRLTSGHELINGFYWGWMSVVWPSHPIPPLLWARPDQTEDHSPTQMTLFSVEHTPVPNLEFQARTSA